MIYDVKELQDAIYSTTDMLRDAVDHDKLNFAMIITQGKDGRWNSRRISFSYNMYELIGFLHNVMLNEYQEHGGV